MRQNRINKIILTVLLFSLCNSCKDTGPINYQNSVITLKPQNLSLSTKEVSFNTPQASSSTFQVQSTNIEWEITGIPDWMTVSPTSGADNATVTVSVTENTLTSNRLGILSFTSTDDSWSYSSPLTVSQLRATSYAVPEIDRIEFNCTDSTATIRITSNNDDWSIKKSSSINWFTVSKDDGCINISVTANSSFFSRSAVIEILTVDGTEYLTIFQQSAKDRSIIEITDRLDFDGEGSTIEIESLASGGEYWVSIESSRPWSVIDCPSWIYVTPSKGIGSGTLIITVDQNTESYDRYGYVIVSLDDMDYQCYIDVWQASVIATDNGSMHFSDKSGSLYLSIYTESDWTALASDNWIILDTESGFGDTQLKVSVTENTTDTVREGFLLITAYMTQIKVLIEQQGKYLNINSSAMNFTSQGGRSQVTLKSNDSWTAITNDDWITLLNTEGIGYCDITIDVADNPSALPRSGYIDFIPVNSKPVRLTVNQAARYLNVSPSAIYISGDGKDTVTCTINTDGIAQVTTQDSWLSISKESSRRYCITAPYNENSRRTGSVTISLTDLIEGSLSTTIPVTQYNKDEPSINGHEYVDLGLSVKWATCNVGADTPEGYGDYYGWGEYERKSRYTWTEYRFCTSENPVKLSKYVSQSMRGSIDFKTTLDLSDDAANVKWGKTWRMPTYIEVRELLDNCTWTWTTQNGVNGYRVTSNMPGYTNKSIFLPAAGMRYDRNNNDIGTVGAYWSSSLYTETSIGAWELNFDSDGASIGVLYGRDCGRTVRPVCP